MTNLKTAILGGIVIAAVVFAVIARRESMDAGLAGESPEIAAAVPEIFEKLAGAANELKGAVVETDVVFDGAAVEDGRVLTYTYTVAGVADRPFDRRIAVMAEDQLSRQSCADKILRPAIDGGGAVRYVYLASGGTRVLFIQVDRQNCPAPE